MNASTSSAAGSLRTGWASRLARLCLALLVFETASGLAITFAGFPRRTAV